MPAITLPDGSVRSFDGPVTGTTIAEAIGPGLAKAALAMEVNGELRDISRPIEDDAALRFITRKDPESLEMIRHDAAHVLAEAVQSLFPGTQVTIGPSIENGFYYDFYRNEPFSPEDFAAIEARMKEIVANAEPFVREVWPRNEAIAFFEEKGERFKAELIRDLPEDEDISIYRQGEWLDLCRGPHLRNTKDVGTAFKLMKVAGAYWRGDHRNPMLTRIYGTAWRDQKELDAHLHQLEEAERRDHRRIGREMDLFHFQEEAVGQIFWHHKGWRLYTALQDYMRRAQTRHGYQEVRTPQLVDRGLWEASGHWDKYRHHMFVATIEDEDKTLALKPMNCPCHVQIFRHGLRSYRELPLRMAEFGACHRYEPSGALHGLMRVRGFTQDDAHIFCTEDQIADETVKFVHMLYEVYKDLGFEHVRVKFADRPEQRAGSDATWDKSEAALKEACEVAGVTYEYNPGEGAFYGPKLEFVLRDAIGRDWQCGTLQVDLVLPERLDASYVGEDSARHRPVMLHRAILGSFERFLGILIEQHAGRFPLWLAPVQVVVASIVSDAASYAEEVAAALRDAGLAAEADVRNDKINAKVREHSVARVPVILVVGRREAEQRTVAMRRLGSQDQENLGFDEVVSRLVTEATPPDLRKKEVKKATQGSFARVFCHDTLDNWSGIAHIIPRRMEAPGEVLLFVFNPRQELTIARPPIPAPPTREGPRVNEEIRVPQVRLIDENGEMAGVLTTRDALARAYGVGLDLLEISPNAEPPVAKILDYGKFKYEQQKKRNEARKKQKVIEIKEVKVRPNIDENDYQVKMRAARGFLADGDKVKVTLRFRGREMAHQELGVKVLERIRTEMEELAKVEQMPRLENRQMIMVLAPK